MTDKPGSTNDGEWQMPDPVFRSSDGFDPREKLKADDIPTESPDKTEEDIEVETAEYPAAVDVQDDTEPTAADPPAPTQNVRAASGPAAKPRGGCVQTIGLIGAVVALSALTIIAALVYFLFYYRSAESTF